LRKNTLLAFAALLTACGYHVAGRADLVPKSIQTIAIPAFSNITTRYKLTDRLPEAISREFISRTRYHIVADPAQADAVLRGAVLSYSSYPTIFDPATGRASGVQLQVTLRVSLVERSSGKVLFNRPNMDVRERYQISTDPAVFFEESDAALDRASQQTARQVVSAILENF
jgi:outer membrane lipopolysaccharide assembly protein LptE/RlpB